MTNCALSEPGILLRMVSPEPASEPDGEAAVTVAGRSVAVRGVATTAAVVSLATWFLLDAVRTRSLASALDAPRWLDEGPFVVAAFVGTVCGVGARSVAITLAVVVAMLTGSAAGVVGADAPRLLLHTFAFFALGASIAKSVANVGTIVAAGVAAAIAVLGWPVLLGSVVVGPVTAALAAMVALAALRLPSRDERGSWSFADSSVTVVVVVLVGWSLPASWWACSSDLAKVVHAGLAAGAWWAAIGRARAVALLLAALAVVAMFVMPRPAAGDFAEDRVLAAGRSLVASYDRATQAMQLLDDGEVVDVANVDHPGAELAATIVHCLANTGDRVLVLGSGVVRLPELLTRDGAHDVEIADAGARGVRDALAADGPVVAAGLVTTAPGRRWSAGWPATLGALAANSRQVVVVTESPVTKSAGFASFEAQNELRRVAGDGLVLQAIAIDHAPATRVRSLLAAAAAVHPWNGVFAVGGSAWLVSAARPPRWPSESAWARWSDDRRWTAHRAHLGSSADLQHALLGVVRPIGIEAAANDPVVRTGRAALAVIWREALVAVPAPEAPESGSTLLHWIGRTADVRAAVEAIRGLHDTTADRARAQSIAAGFLHVGAPAACLQAALGLPDATGVALLSADQATLRAHALDPTFFVAPPPVFADVPRPKDQRGDLEDLAHLPEGERLVELCSAETPLAVALRARFPSQCARALVAAMANAPLPPERAQALREIADPFVLTAAARGLAARQAPLELLAIWRGDLPMPEALGAVARGSIADRRVLAAALAGRRDAASWRTLVDLLVAPEIEVRRAAAVSLRVAVGDGVAYDPEWSGSALNEAADRLRTLHNRKP